MESCGNIPQGECVQVTESRERCGTKTYVFTPPPLGVVIFSRMFVGFIRSYDFYPADERMAVLELTRSGSRSQRGQMSEVVFPQYSTN